MTTTPRPHPPIAPFLLLLLVVISCTKLHAGDPIPLAPGKGRAFLYGGWMGADHYRNIDRDLKRFDTTGTTYNATIFGVTASYGLLEGLEANLELPIGYFSVTGSRRFPDRSIFAPAYLGLGATYGILGGPLALSASAMLRLPPGFHNGIYDDPEHPSFLSDGYLQASGGVNAGYYSQNFWITGHAAYNWRAEEPVDEIKLGARLGLTRVEGAGIVFGINGVIPTADVTTPARPFYAGASGSTEELRRSDGGTGRFLTIDREEYIDFEGGAYVNITEQFILTGNYSIRLTGRNTLTLAGGFFGVGYQW